MTHTKVHTHGKNSKSFQILAVEKGGEGRGGIYRRPGIKMALNFKSNTGPYFFFFFWENKTYILEIFKYFILWKRDAGKHSILYISTLILKITILNQFNYLSKRTATTQGITISFYGFFYCIYPTNIYWALPMIDAEDIAKDKIIPILYPKI